MKCSKFIVSIVFQPIPTGRHICIKGDSSMCEFIVSILYKYSYSIDTYLYLGLAYIHYLHTWLLVSCKCIFRNGGLHSIKQIVILLWYTRPFCYCGHCLFIGANVYTSGRKQHTVRYIKLIKHTHFVSNSKLNISYTHFMSPFLND